MRILSLLLILAFPAMAQAGDTRLETVRFKQGGLDRSFLIYAPDNQSGPRPLVLVLHGGGGTARSMLRLTRGRFNALADQYGFVAVYPNAIDKMWDFGEGKVSQALTPRRDDLAYFRQVLALVSDRADIDPDRVFATGISRGGQASYFLACKLPGQFRAIAPVTMPLPAYLADDCATVPPVGLALLNGTADPLVPYDGGEITVGKRTRGQVLSTDQTLALWRDRNGCANRPVRETRIDPVADGTIVDVFEWTGCARAPVVLYRITGGGHTWPSGPQYLPRRVIGQTTSDIDGATQIWQFFSRFE